IRTRFEKKKFPSYRIPEGSVTLSCSSDANPAADYTWFRDNQPMLWEPRRPYTLDPVSSKDRGTYRCQAENQYGYLGSNSVFHRCPVLQLISAVSAVLSQIIYQEWVTR
uniref:Ig-like domain-containing protein n=1 Tax=Gadus morhua TaxID=8049 RepID=A0A8C5BB88_GADMO